MRVIAGACLAAMLVFCSMLAINRGLASLYAYPGKSSLSMWREGKLLMQQQRWKDVRGSLEKALFYDGRNPDLLHEAGAAYDAEVAYYPPGDTAANANRDSARQFYVSSLSGRPTWPHGWIAFALVKYRLNQIDAEFYNAMHQAVALGPWEPGVKYVVAEIGMHHWNNFDNDMHKLVIGVIHDAVNNRDSAMDMLNLVRRYDMLDMVCNDDGENELVVNYCKQYHHPE